VAEAAITRKALLQMWSKAQQSGLKGLYILVWGLVLLLNVTVSAAGVHPGLIVTVSQVQSLDANNMTTFSAGQVPFRVELAGDLNYDGLMDFIVCDSTATGAVYTVMGSPAGSGNSLPSTQAASSTLLATGNAGQYWGHGIALTGDLNGDGVQDIIAGTTISLLHVFLLNRDGSFRQSFIQGTGQRGMPTMTSGQRCGIDVGVVGHMDGNNIIDIAMGCDNENNLAGSGLYALRLQHEGAVVSGGVHWFDANAAPINVKFPTNHGIGFSVTGAGDVDGNGALDIAFGAVADSSFDGAIGILLLTTGHAIASVVRIDDNSGNIRQQAALSAFGGTGRRLGDRLATAGDLDGDGRLDLLASTTVGSGGRVDILLLDSSGQVKAGYPIAAGLGGLDDHLTLVTGSSFGRDVTSAGDWFGTGKLAFLVIASALPVTAGGFHFVETNIPAPPGSCGWALDAVGTPCPQRLVQAAHEVGDTAAAFPLAGGATLHTMVPLGDVNGDGFIDYAASDVGADSGDGVVFISLGGANFDVGAGSVAIAGDDASLTPSLSASGAAMGSAMAPAGDTNLDGTPDLYVGVPGADSEDGSLWLFQLTATGGLLSGFKLTAAGHGMPAVTSDSRCGGALAVVPDVDGNGLPELLMGCAAAGIQSSVWVLYMGLQGRITVHLQHGAGSGSLSGVPSTNRFGAAVAPLQLSFSAAAPDSVEYVALAAVSNQLVFIRSTRAGGINSATPVTRSANGVLLTFMHSTGALAQSLAAAGDVDGDGVGDVLIGSPDATTAAGAGAGAVYIMLMNADRSIKGGYALHSAAGGVGQAMPGLSAGDGFGQSAHMLGGAFFSSSVLLVTHKGAAAGTPPVWLPLNTELIKPQSTPSLVAVTSTVSFPAVNGTIAEVLASGLPALGSTSGHRFGAAIAPIGDLNGDGFMDMVVGAPGYDSSKGAYVVLHLGGDGLVLGSPAPVLVAHATAGDQYGASICGFGAFEDDDTRGLIVGAPGTDASRGAVWLLPLDAAGRDKGDGVQIVSGVGISTLAAGQRLGFSCAVLENIHGDGPLANTRPDLILGAPGTAGSLEGAVIIYSLSASLVQLGSSSFSGPSQIGADFQTSEFGASVASARFFDSDGIPDVAVGEPRSTYGGLEVGTVTIVRLSVNLLEIERFVFGPSTTAAAGGLRTAALQHWGASLGVVGDVTQGTGQILIVGAPAADGNRGGFDILRLQGGSFSAITTYQSSMPGTGVPGDLPAGGKLGAVVADLGDIDGDGFRDFALGAPDAASDGFRIVRSGLAAHGGSCAGPLRAARMPCSLESFAFNFTDYGIITAASINSGNDRLGFSLCAIGDVNRDGLVDFAAGDPEYSPSGNRDGRVQIIFGQVHADQNVTAVPIAGNVGPFNAGSPTEPVLGCSLAAIGDLNRDGVPDIASGTCARTSFTGGFYIIFLTANGSMLSATAHLPTGAGSVLGVAVPSALCGHSLTALGDVDHDRNVDIAVGCPSFDVTKLGHFYSAALLPDGTHRASARTDDPASVLTGHFAYAMTFIGDLNADGVPEIAVGAPRVAAPYVQSGRVHIMSMHDDLSSSEFAVIAGKDLSHGGTFDELFGWIMGTPGDINGDGVPDLLVSLQPSFSPGGAVLALLLTAEGKVRSELRLDAQHGRSTHLTPHLSTYAVLSLGDADGSGRVSMALGRPGSTGQPPAILRIRTTLTTEKWQCPPSLVGLHGACNGSRPLALQVADMGGITTTPARTSNAYTVAALGDVNGDGVVDFASGDLSHNSGCGSVHIVFGVAPSQPRADFTNPAATLLTGCEDGGLANSMGFGGALAALGDIDQDGVPDMLAGVAGVNSAGGGALVIRLLASGAIKGTPLLLESAAHGMPTYAGGSNCGTSVGGLGDFLRDGVPDVVLGCQGGGGGFVLLLQMLRTGRVGLSQKVAASDYIPGLQVTGGFFGAAVSGLGDVDGDGFNDVAVGDMNDDTIGLDFGAVVILFCVDFGVPHSAFTIRGTHPLLDGLVTIKEFGRSFTLLGDVSSPPDGIADLMIGMDTQKAGDPAGTDQGRVFILELNRNRFDPIQRVQVMDPVAGGINEHTDMASSHRNFVALNALGDLDGDGRVDVLAGALTTGSTLRIVRSNLPISTDSGCATSLSLQGLLPHQCDAWSATVAPHSSVHSETAFPGSHPSSIGSLVPFGDFNADGVLDFAASDWRASLDDGVVFIAAGNLDGTLHAPVVDISTSHARLETDASTTGSQFGRALLAAGDVDLDGQVDIYIGAPQYGTSAGALWLLLLQPDGDLKTGILLTETVHGMPPAAANRRCGFSLAHLGAAEHGLQDVLVGCPGGTAQAGQVLLLRMGMYGLAHRHSTHNTASGTDFGVSVPVASGFGASVASLGNADDEGGLDYAALAPGSQQLFAVLTAVDGSVASHLVHSAFSQGMDAFVHLPVSGPLGSFLAPAGDVDGNGRQDLVLGSPDAAREAGALYIVRMASAGAVLGGRTLALDAASITAVHLAQNTSGMLSLVATFGGYAPPSIFHIIPSYTGTIGIPSLPPSVATAEGALLPPVSALVHSVTSSVPPTSIAGLASSGEDFGAALTFLGDMNFDGHADFAVGVPGHGTDGAVAIVFSAGVSGLPAPVHVLLTGQSGNVDFGGSVCAHDLLNEAASADTVVDLIVGSPSADSGRGQVHLLRLDGDFSIASQALLATGSTGVGTLAANQGFGASCAVIGDVDGAGNLDFVIGARGAVGSLEGKAFTLLQGSGVPTSGAALLGPADAAVQQGFGWSVAAVGNLDGLAGADVAIGEPGTSIIAVLFLSTSAAEVSRALIRRTGNAVLQYLQPTGSLGFGRSLSSAGDVDGDGLLDLLVGLEQRNASSGGLDVLLLTASGSVKGGRSFSRGSPGGVSTSVLPDTGRLGASVAAIGSVDGSGRLNIALAQPGSSAIQVVQTTLSADAFCDSAASPVSELHCGDSVQFRYLNHTEIDAPALFAGASGMGHSLALLGDVDGDGFTDYAAGAARYNDSSTYGRVHVIFTRGDMHFRAHSDIVSPYTSGLSLFGQSVAGIGDLNRDGVPDLAVGSGGADESRGAFSIFLLRADGTEILHNTYSSGSALLGTLAAHQRCGMSLAPLGDLSGDLHMDIAVGCFGFTIAPIIMVVGLRSMGTAEFKSDITGPFLGVGAQSDSGAGRSLAALGDMSGNGTMQLAVGVPLQDSLSPPMASTGSIIVMTLLPDFSLGGILMVDYADVAAGVPLVATTILGLSLTAPGDVSGDGVPDLIARVYHPTRAGLLLLHMATDGSVQRSQRLDPSFGGLPERLASNPGWGAPVAAAGGGPGSNGRLVLLMGDPNSNGLIAAVDVSIPLAVGYCPPDLQLLQECPGNERPSMMLSANNLQTFI